MARPYSMDLRERVVAAVENGGGPSSRVVLVPSPCVDWSPSWPNAVWTSTTGQSGRSSTPRVSASKTYGPPRLQAISAI
jgi:hypothetical protein